MEVGNWFADFQGIVHKIAFKNQGTLMLEHYVSQDIAPAKTWIHQNESMRQIINLAHNGEVLLVDTLNKDNTRTIVAKQNGKVITTTIDENGTKETKEEAAKNIELFSRFLQEDNGALETKELKSTFQPLSDKEIKEIVSQWDLENPRAQDRVFVSKVEGKELEQIQKEFHFKGNYEIAREIDAQHIKHALSRHGDETIEESRNQIPITLDEILDYQSIIKSADVREVSGKNILYKKQINGHYVVVEEALTGKNRLEFVTMWKSKGNITTPPTSSSKGYDQDRTLGGDYDNANSTPQNINNSLKNSEPVENAAEGSNTAQSDLRSKYPTLDSVDEAMRSLAAKLHETRPLEREIGELEKQIEAKSLKLSNNKIKRIIYNDNLNIGVKEYKEKYNKENGIDELRERLEALTKQHSELKKSLEPTQEEWDKLYRLSKEFKVEQELKERREEYASELLEYGYTKEQVENLTQLAETNPLARQIMENYESDTIGHGYSGYSMSNNAINAYENGQKPLSKWTAQDAKDFGEVIGQKVSLKFLKEFLKEFGERGYHHTSKFYNETKFYSLSEALLSSRGREHLEKNLGEILTKAPPAKQNIDNVGAQKAANTSTAAAASDVQAPKLDDYAVTMESATELAARDKKQRLGDNLEALRVLSQLENGAPLSKEAQEALGRYSGFGGTDYEKAHNELREILQTFPNADDAPLAELLFNQIITTTKNAYYTPHEVISAIYAQLGFVRGRVLEPSMGIGNFFAAMPESLRNNTQRVGIELDSVSAKIAQYLHPNARVENMSFEEFGDNLGFDLVIGNPPYEGKMKGMPIVAAFLQKSLELTKDNGIVVQVVSNSFLDNVASSAARAMIAKDAEFLGAVRLPSDTFSGTNVATDIVVFQKRKGGGDSAFVGTAQHNVGTQSLALNDYYHAHPEHILGDLRIIDTNYNGKRWNVDSNGSIARLPDVLESIFKNRFGSSDAIMGNAEQQDIRRYTGKARNGSLVAVGENVYVVRAGDRFTRNLEEIDWADRINKSSRGKSFEALSDVGQRKRLSDSKKAQEMARDYITLRDNLERLRKAEMENDVNMEDYRDQLRECYDYFKRKHCNGDRIAENRIFNAAFVDEPSYWLVRDLDVHGEHKILRERVGIPIEIPKKAENLKDAIAISKTYAGKIDAEFLETLLDDKFKVRQAYDEGELFDVNGEILTKEEYLSGDLGAKIDALESFEVLNPHQQTALRLLKESLPKPLSLDAFHFAPHSKWIPYHIMRDFLDSLDVKWQHTDLGGWEVLKSYSSKLDEFSAVTGDMRHEGYAVLQSVLHNKPLAHKKTIHGTTYTFHEQYIENQKARDRLLQYFYDFIRENYKQELESAYNKQFSRILPRKVSAGHFLPPSDEIAFFPHQKEALAFAMGTKNVLLDQTVGAGKTYEMVAMGAAFKRTGMAKRPAYAVPNHLTMQWEQAYHKLYPNANIITIPTTTKERKETLARIANSDIDFDAIIIPHSTLNQINPSAEFRLKILTDELNEITLAESTYKAQTSNPSKSQLTQLENKRKAILEKIKALDKQQATHNEENAISFEDLKIDALFVDEAHLYKNIGFVSSNQTLRGLGAASASDKARNLLSIVRQLQSRDGHVVFATGTPLVNSVSEVYAWQKYLAPEFLTKNNIKSYDDWLDMFGKIESKFERTPVGTYKEVNRLRGIRNLDALSKSYAQFSYFTDVSQTQIKRPQVERVSIEVDCSEAQKEYMSHCLQRYQKLQNGEKAQRFKDDNHLEIENDNYLNITNDGINCALDYRLIDKDAEDFEGSKINRAVSEAFKLYKQTEKVKGTQLLFLDRGTPKPSKRAHKEIQDAFQRYWEAPSEREASLYAELENLAEKNGFASVEGMRASVMDNNRFSLYEDIRTKLIKMGVRENEIAFIHDYTSDEAKAKLFEQVRNGDVRFLIGSTKKMGAGMNVQDRVVGLHHIDAAWNPADLEQRDGRGIRQGNIFMKDNPDFKLKVFYYLTKNSTDAIYYAKLEQKQASIRNFRSGHAIERNVDEQIELDYAEFAAAISGDKREIIKAQWQRELAELEAEKRGLSGRASNETKEKEMLLAATKELPKTIEQLKADIEIAKQRGKRELSEAEIENLKSVEIEPSNSEPLFVLDNYEVFLEHNNIGNSYRLCAVSENGHEILLRGWQQNMIQSVAHYARELLKATTEESLEKQLGAKTIELAKKQERLKALQDSDFSQRLDELENAIAKTKENLDKLAKGMAENAAAKESANELTRLENGTIVFKDTKGKEHTIGKEIQEQWTNELGLESVEQDFIPKFSNEIKEALGDKEVKLTLGSLFKLIANKRTQYIPQIRETLEKPDVIIEHQDNLIFAKQIDDKKYFTSVGKDFETHITIVSNAPKKATTLENKLKGEGKVIYQSSKLENLRYNQAFTDERFSTNKTDKTDSIPNNIKSGLENADIDKTAHELKRVEQEIAANKEKLDKSELEERQRLREAYKELVQKKRAIKAELADKALETLQNRKAERSEAMNVNLELIESVGIEGLLKIIKEPDQQKAVRALYDSIMQRPDVEYISKDGSATKIKKMLGSSSQVTTKGHVSTKEKDVYLAFDMHENAPTNVRTIDDIAILQKELKEAKEIHTNNGKTINSNMHAGSGIATGSIAGIETDEQGNISFSPEKFALGFLAGAGGSKAISSALQHLKKNPEHKKRLIENLAHSLAQNLPDTMKKYPLLELVQPKKMSTSAQGLQAQTQTMISKLEQKEKRGLFNVTYNGKFATNVYRDLENIDNTIRLARGDKDKGGMHIKLKHTVDTTQNGYVKPQEVMNLGKNLREFLKKYEPFVDTNGARIYEWENNEKVRFRLVVNEAKREADSNPTQLHRPFSEEIITFYSDRNLKNPMQFKNPALGGT